MAALSCLLFKEPVGCCNLLLKPLSEYSPPSSHLLTSYATISPSAMKKAYEDFMDEETDLIEQRNEQLFQEVRERPTPLERRLLWENQALHKILRAEECTNVWHNIKRLLRVLTIFLAAYFTFMLVTDPAPIHGFDTAIIMHSSYRRGKRCLRPVDRQY